MPEQKTLDKMQKFVDRFREKTGTFGYPDASITDETPKGERTFPHGYTYPQGGRFSIIHAMAGDCPIKLKPQDGDGLPSEEDIQKWVGDVRQTYLNQGMYLKNQALRLWAADQVNHNLDYSPVGPEMTRVYEIIDNMPDIKENTHNVN